MAYDGISTLYLTDSADKLFYLDATTLQTKAPPRQIYDRKMARPVHGVNELEWVDGELWGNVFPMYQGEASEVRVTREREAPQPKPSWSWLLSSARVLASIACLRSASCG